MSAHRVRIGQRGWNRDRAATTLDEVAVGIGVDWVEIDGHRFDEVMSVRLVAAPDEVTVGPTLELQLVGPVELVYLGGDGEPLGSVEVEETPTLEYDVFMERAT